MAFVYPNSKVPELRFQDHVCRVAIVEIHVEEVSGLPVVSGPLFVDEKIEFEIWKWNPFKVKHLEEAEANSALG